MKAFIVLHQLLMHETYKNEHKNCISIYTHPLTCRKCTRKHIKSTTIPMRISRSQFDTINSFVVGVETDNVTAERRWISLKTLHNFSIYRFTFFTATLLLFFSVETSKLFSTISPVSLSPHFVTPRKCH